MTESPTVSTTDVEQSENERGSDVREAERGRHVGPLVEDLEAEAAEAERLSRAERNSSALAAALLSVAFNFLTDFFLLGLVGSAPQGILWIILASGMISGVLVYSGVQRLLT